MSLGDFPHTRWTAGGGYTISHVPVGQYVVEAQASGFVREYYQEQINHHEANAVQVDARQATGGIDFTLDAGVTISGTVRDPEGQPVHRASVSVHDASYRFHAGTESDEGGGFVLSVPPGTYMLTARPPEGSQWASSEQMVVDAITVGETVYVGDVLLSRPALIGQVKDPDEADPIPMARVEAHTEDWSIHQESQTDEGGYFRIGGLPSGLYTLDAYPPDEGPGSQYTGSAPRTVTVTVGVQNNVGVVRLTRPQISGLVTFPDGSTPAAHAWVEARSADWMMHKGASADDEGRFAIGGLSHGTYYVRAHPPGDGGGADYSSSVEVEVTLAGEPVVLTEPLRLQGVNVRGRVVDPDGNPVCCVGVDVHTLDHVWHESTGTGDDGRFALGGLPPGDYVVEIHAPWGTSGWLSPDPLPSFTIEDSGSSVDLGDVAFRRAAKFIQGRVVRAGSGAGVPNVEANAWQRDGKAWAHDETDGDGRFSLGVSGGTWEVMIQPVGGGEANWVYNGYPKKISFAEGETTKEITFTVQSADAHVVGEVRGPEGERLAPWSVHVEVRDPHGGGNGASLGEDGRFDVPVVAGTYEVWLHVDEWQYPIWGSPELEPITVEEGEPYDLGTLNLVAKNSFIAGHVTRSSDGQGVAGVDVDAWRPVAGGWAHTTTAADGSYSLAVTDGEWEIGIHLPFTSTYVSGLPPRRVTVDEGQTTSEVDFVLQEASGSIAGLVVDESDRVLTDVYGWAYARQGMGPPVAGAPVEGGRFTINVPAGSYWVGVGLPPESNYTPVAEEPVDIAQLRARSLASAAPFEGGEKDTPQAAAAAYRERTEQRVTVTGEEPTQVRITVVPNNARIVGQFREADGSPVTGLEGEVFAMSGMGGAWRSTAINPDGSYELNVAAGTWNLGYWLMDEEYVNSPPPESRVTVEASDEFVMNFTLVAADSLIRGYLQQPDGSGLTHGWAWAHRERAADSARVDTGSESQPPDGYFEINVPAGEYDVGGCAPEELGFVQPAVQQVAVSPSSPADVTLRFRESDGTITGQVFVDGSPAVGAWVWAWSESGAHAGTPTDDQGRYQLNVITSAVWHLGAAFHYNDSEFYETVQDYVVSMTGPTASQDLELSLSQVELPDAQTVHFDGSSPALISLEDGTEINIPAGALAVTGTVKLVITPMVEELANTLTARPFGYGYAIHAFDSNNRQITSSFNQNVTISFYYTEEELSRRGVGEDNLSPAYFSTTTNSWTKVESFTVDRENNRITAQINHFSVWAMTTGQGGNGGSFGVFLPLVIRQ